MSSNSPAAEVITIQASEQLPESPSAIESSWTSFIPMLLIFVVFYFLLIRPQEKRRKEHEQLVTSVKKGEDVVTSGGIYGKVVKVNETESTVMLEIAENTVIKVSKSSILDITSRKTTIPVQTKEEKPSTSVDNKKKLSKK